MSLLRLGLKPELALNHSIIQTKKLLDLLKGMWVEVFPLLTMSLYQYASSKIYPVLQFNLQKTEVYNSCDLPKRMQLVYGTARIRISVFDLVQAPSYTRFYPFLYRKVEEWRNLKVGRWEQASQTTCLWSGIYMSGCFRLKARLPFTEYWFLRFSGMQRLFRTEVHFSFPRNHTHHLTQRCEHILPLL